MAPRIFDRRFAELVLPDLRNQARILASLHVWMGYRFSTVAGVLWDEAYRRGASYLADPEACQDELTTLLLEAIAATEAERDRARARGMIA